MKYQFHAHKHSSHFIGISIMLDVISNRTNFSFLSILHRKIIFTMYTFWRSIFPQIQFSPLPPKSSTLTVQSGRPISPDWHQNFVSFEIKKKFNSIFKNIEIQQPTYSQVRTSTLNNFYISHQVKLQNDRLFVVYLSEYSIFSQLLTYFYHFLFTIISPFFQFTNTKFSSNFCA